MSRKRWKKRKKRKNLIKTVYTYTAIFFLCFTIVATFNLLNGESKDSIYEITSKQETEPVRNNKIESVEDDGFKNLLKTYLRSANQREKHDKDIDMKDLDKALVGIMKDFDIKFLKSMKSLDGNAIGFKIMRRYSK